MSNQGYYDHGQNPSSNSNMNLPSTNPWADQSGNPPPQHQQYQTQQQQSYSAYQPPPGPPPSHNQPTGHAPKRADTFKESDFVPDSERGEQREAMQQFEMNHAGQQSQADRDVEMLQREFPGVDGSLVAALYGDAGSVGATREMLQELSEGQGGK